MKAKTKLQVEVMSLTKQLPYIEDKVLSWAKVECLKHIGYATKNRVICMDCGQKFSTELVSRNKAVCPYCKTKLVIEQSKCRTNKQDIYVAYAQVCGEFQVIRNFELISYHKSDNQVYYYFIEVLQHWIKSDKKREVVALNHTQNGYIDSWNGTMEIRKNYRNNYYYNADKYDIYPVKLHPSSKFKPEYVKYGIDRNLSGITSLEAISYISKNPKCETLLKAKQYSLLSLSLDRSFTTTKTNTYWDSIKICMRNKYIVKDANIWFDYLDLLKYFKKDLNNAYYVCPKDLNKQHDIYVKRKGKIMDFERMQRDYLSLLKYYGKPAGKDFIYPRNLKAEYKILNDRKKLEGLEKKKKELSKLDIKYKKFIEKFLNIEMLDKEIEISPLKSVEEFYTEGLTMNHCVYTNSYYEKPESLILSAHIKNEPIETVEVSLKSFKVVQSRGKFNKDTKYHDRIIKLVNRNISKIKKLQIA